MYIPLAGSATLILDDDQHRLESGVWARVGISQLRRVVPGEGGGRHFMVRQVMKPMF